MSCNFPYFSFGVCLAHLLLQVRYESRKDFLYFHILFIRKKLSFDLTFSSNKECNAVDIFWRVTAIRDSWAFFYPEAVDIFWRVTTIRDSWAFFYGTIY
ncbi:hypothetical protein EUGRSUZ_I00901 [Eucalyptus grandis]|uniref:Uncharacterized protein n=2 Tax=Eucalyptus grandis TaxID=71139 RepID=A0ACC3JG51_EUCGR|nr:hypothetical protein EUGRSUZ_I00901 [Eucalyptus grandis]